MDGEKQLFSAGVVGGIAVACIIWLSPWTQPQTRGSTHVLVKGQQFIIFIIYRVTNIVKLKFLIK
jgi:hypothetical protein